jgi:4-hydroxy-tetrahydrodipicolinate synthase
MKVPEYVSGSIAPTFTVFQQDGGIDEQGQRNFLDFLLQSDAIRCFFVRSGMGLMYTYSMDDTKQMARLACGHINKRSAVIVGCSGIWDRNYDSLPDPDLYRTQGIELGKYAFDNGADGVVYTVPEGLLPQNGESINDLLLRYFTAVCAEVPGPVFIYQPPGTKAEYMMKPELLGQLADIDNLVGTKVSTPEAHYMYELIRAVRGKDFAYIVGHEMAFYAGLVIGVRACIGQGTTVNPQIFRAMLAAYDRNDWDGVLRAQDSINTMCLVSPNPVDFMKKYATEKGFPTPMFDRSQKSNPYASDRTSITQEEYDRFKPIYEAELAKFE